MKGILLFALVLPAFVIVGCDKGGEMLEEPTKTIAVTGVSLNKTALLLKEGAAETLTATISPSGADNKAVAWSSSDSAIATVNATGKVTGVKAGSAVIIVTTSDGGKIATCTVTVIDESDEPNEPDEPDNSDTQGVLINGITWATTNVNASGEFAAKPEDDGFFYTFDEAQTACPSGWRTPTKQEFEVLADTNSKWTTLNGVNGRLFDTGDHTFFLPAARYRGIFTGSLDYLGSGGFYWSSTAYNSTTAYYLHFHDFSVYPSSANSRAFGFRIRCVRDNDTPDDPEDPEISDVHKGVLINGITWATHNVGEKGQFVNNPEDYGRFYYFTEAKIACPLGWRTPTEQEFEVLADTNSEWTTLNGVNGRQFGSGDHTIFLPAAGYHDYSNGSNSLNFQGINGYYWSSTAYTDNKGYKLYFANSTVLTYENSNQVGLSVRCVLDNENPDDHQGVTINGITWATRNVGAKGQFMNNIEDYGRYYSFEEANTACPSGWRTPTSQEFEVLASTSSEWTSLNGHNGRRFRNGNHTIFLPATGYRLGNFSTVNGASWYWSSTAYSDDYGYHIGFSSSGVSPTGKSDRSLGLAVRCVRK
jgi:uncharacterized protein (TIGR02145 family)